MTAMNDCFVDVSYRGLPVGRKLKLTQIGADSGYVEVPAPMPVGTSVAIVVAEDLSIPATVTAIQEQVGGATRPPGMQLRPALDEAAARAWWEARIPPPPEATPEPVADADVADDGRTTAVMEAVSDEAAAMDGTPGQGELADDGRATTVMAAMADADVAPRGLDPRTTVPGMAPEAFAGPRTREPRSTVPDVPPEADAPPLADDGRSTTMMAAVDLAALGLDPSSSGTTPGVGQAGEPAEGSEAPSKPKSRRRRKKKS